MLHIYVVQYLKTTNSRKAYNKRGIWILSRTLCVPDFAPFVLDKCYAPNKPDILQKSNVKLKSYN